MLQSYAVPNTSMDEIETYLKPYWKLVWLRAMIDLAYQAIKRERGKNKKKPHKAQ